ncbi:MAG: FAD-dependent oxidoreductase [Chloroflexi bacterium]|nr:FAD-dependent oxidoreductase [Chloroflexota bacterium]
MSQVGSDSHPLRVAVVGAGPAGFYAVERLFKEKALTITVDMYDRLPTPYGLVRAGVAPDHQKIKSVTRIFDRVAAKPRFRFFGNVEVGKDVAVADLRRFYHAILYSTGAQTDKNLPIPGIDLKNSYAATEFVAWYNGHPDYRDYEFDLSQERVAVVGVGNVAVDVARILSRTVEELATTDIADYALEALRHSQVKEVIMLGRRGVAQAAFTANEAKELGELAGANICVLPEEAQLGPLSEASLAEADRGTVRKVQIVQGYAERPSTDKPRKLTLRFLLSPVELMGDDDGRVQAMRLVHNELYKTESGTLRPRATEKFEEWPVGLVFRSIGYRGVPIEGVPFNDRWGVILNEHGRVIDPDTNEPVLGEYTAGWIKRGPSGVIGTNKPDAAESVECLLADVRAGKILSPESPAIEAVESFIQERQPRHVRYEDWLKLNEMEVARGQELGRPRLKFTDIEKMLTALNK